MAEQSETIEQLLIEFRKDLAVLLGMPTTSSKKKEIHQLIHILEEKRIVIQSKLLDFSVANDTKVEKNAGVLKKIRQEIENPLNDQWPGKLLEIKSGLLSLIREEKALLDFQKTFTSLELQLVNYKIKQNIVTTKDYAPQKSVSSLRPTGQVSKIEIWAEAIEMLPIVRQMNKSAPVAECTDESQPTEDIPLNGEEIIAEDARNHGKKNRRIQIQSIVVQKRLIWILLLCLVLLLLVTVMNMLINFLRYKRN